MRKYLIIGKDGKGNNVSSVVQADSLIDAVNTSNLTDTEIARLIE